MVGCITKRNYIEELIESVICELLDEARLAHAAIA